MAENIAFVVVRNYNLTITVRTDTQPGEMGMKEMTKQKNHLVPVLLLAWLTYTVAYLCRVNISTALEKLEVGLSVSVEYLGGASSVYFVTYAVGQLINGIVGDRVDPRRFIMLAAALTGGINVILGFQTSGALFLLLWGLNGFCQSMFWGSLLRLLSFYTKAEQRKNVSTIMSTTSVMGYFLSWVVLGGVFEPFGYMPYFAVPGVIALGLVPVWMLLSRKLPANARGIGAADTLPLSAVAQEFFHDRLYFICLLCMVVGAIQEGAVFWLPMIFTNVLALGEGSLILLMLIPLAKLCGVFLARRVLTGLKDNARTAMLCMLTVSLVITGVLLVCGNRTSVVTVVLIALLIAGINASNWYMISYLPLHFAGRNIVSTLAGAFDFSTYMGAAFMSGALGVLLMRFGWIAVPAVWLVLILGALVLAAGGAGACLALKGKRRE